MRSAGWVRQFLAGIVALLVTLIWVLVRHHGEPAEERSTEPPVVEAGHTGRQAH